MIDDAMHFVVGDEGAVHARRQPGARRQVEHVALAEQRFGAHLVEDGARVDLAGYLEGMRVGMLALIRPVITLTRAAAWPASGGCQRRGSIRRLSVDLNIAPPLRLRRASADPSPQSGGSATPTTAAAAGKTSASAAAAPPRPPETGC